MRPRSGWLRRLYYRIGIHAAPPGTLLFFLHRRMRALTRRRLNRYASGDIFARSSLNFVVCGIVFVLHLGKVVVLHAEFTHRGMARSVYASLPVNITARYFYPGCTPRTGSGGSPQRSRRRRSKL